MALTKASLVDLNANELILDLDADTSIRANTDDTVDIKIAGNVEVKMTATALAPGASDGNALGTAALEWSDLFLADGAVINFGDDQDVSLTHVADTGILLSSTDKLMFNDASQFIQGASATVLDIAATDEIELTATLIDVVGNLAVSGTIIGAGALTAATSITVGSAVLTEAELETLDGITVGTAIASKVVTTDANIDTSGQRNLTITGELDAATGDFSGDVDIDGTANLDVVDIDGATQIDATVTVGVNGTGYDVQFFGDTTGSHLLWDQSADDLILAGAAGLIIPDGGNIGSASDPDAIAIGADGDVTLTQDLELHHDGAIISFGGDGDVTLTHVHNDGLILNTDMQLQFGDAGTFIHQSADGVLDLVSDTEIELNATTIDVNGNLDVSGTIVSAGTITGTLATAAQGNVTSLGTLTALTVDNITINGNDISSTAGTDLTITPLSGQQIVLDGTIVVDAGVVTGATSITSTAFVGGLTGNVTGNASGTALTVTQAAQSSITSLGTLTALTVDDVAVDGKVITMTGSSGDTFVTTVAANGATSLVTTDAAAAAAHLQITADGTVDIDSAGVLTLDSGAAINIEPAAGSAILLDGTISVDAGVVTGATSITSTAFVGNLTGTVATATQNSITTATGLVSVGALDSGSITSGFTSIDTGAGGIATTGNLSGGNIQVADDITHTGDANTYLSFDADSLTMFNGGVNNLYLAPGSVVFNEGSADVDFRIESNNDASAFFLQGSDGNIGFGTNSPAFTEAQQGGDFVTIYGQGTNGSILELASNKNTNDDSVGIVSFVNTENSNSAAGSRHYIAQIRGKVLTDDSNAGDDSGGNLVFQTKANGGAISDKMIITGDGRGLSQFTAKAWGNVNQVGTQALTDSHNISSISDVAVGKTRFTFANAMANVDYACVASIRAEATEAEHVNFAQHTTGYVDIFNVYRLLDAGAVFVDSQQLSMITFGD